MEHKYPTPLFFISFFLVFLLFRLGYACPAGLGKRFIYSPPQEIELENNVKSKIRGCGVICASREKNKTVKSRY